MKKYKIQLVKKYPNTFQSMMVNCFESREEWQSALGKLTRALSECNCSSLVSYAHLEEIDIAYVTIESK